MCGKWLGEAKASYARQKVWLGGRSRQSGKNVMSMAMPDGWRSATTRMCDLLTPRNET